MERKTDTMPKRTLKTNIIEMCVIFELNRTEQNFKMLKKLLDRS